MVIAFKLLVKEYRDKRNLTQKQLAKLSKLSKGYISDIERGRIPGFKALEKISIALKVNIGGLIKDDVDFTKENKKLAPIRKLRVKTENVSKKDIDKIEKILDELIESGELKDKQDIFNLCVSRLIEIADSIDVDLRDLLCYLCYAYKKSTP